MIRPMYIKDKKGKGHGRYEGKIPEEQDRKRGDTQLESRTAAIANWLQAMYEG